LLLQTHFAGNHVIASVIQKSQKSEVEKLASKLRTAGFLVATNITLQLVKSELFLGEIPSMFNINFST